MKQGISASRDQVRGRAKTVAVVLPRELEPISKMAVYDPAKDRAWREVYAKIDTGKTLK